MEVRSQLPSEITITIDGKAYKCREILGHLDESWMGQFIDPETSSLMWDKIWFKRINAMVVEPPITEFDYLQMGKRTIDTLKLAFEKLNSPDLTSFLPPKKKDQTGTQ